MADIERWQLFHKCRIAEVVEISNPAGAVTVTLAPKLVAVPNSPSLLTEA